MVVALIQQADFDLLDKCLVAREAEGDRRDLRLIVL